MSFKKSAEKKNKKVLHIQNNTVSKTVKSPVDHISRLQRTIGNQAVQRLIKRDTLHSKVGIKVPGSIYKQPAPKAPPSSAPVTKAEIEDDLNKARKWAKESSEKLSRYARIVINLAKEPKFSYKISTTPLGRGETIGVYCPLMSNFNVDPNIDKPIPYAGKINKISKSFTAISNSLGALKLPNFRSTSVMDSRCEDAGAFVINKSLPIYLCTGYWLDVFKRPATLIHEVAHLKGMDDEEYLKSEKMGLPSKSCIKWNRFSIDSGKTVKNPDSYAYFASDLR